MKYFIDTEFIEGIQKGIFNNKPTIDLISIGIVCEDGREYYAISKDFNLKEAWNRYDCNINIITKKEGPKTYWLRENVLKHIFDDLYLRELHSNFSKYINTPKRTTYKNFKKLVNKYGKTNKQIAEEIKHFIANRPIENNKEQWILDYDTKDVQFYGYYADYDWVVFCWLFGKMIDLPKGFPMYCIDLKQTLDEKANNLTSFELSKLAHSGIIKHNVYSTYDSGVLKCSKTDLLKNALNYPKQINEHNALVDARWTYELYKFLNIL